MTSRLNLKRLLGRLLSVLAIVAVLVAGAYAWFFAWPLRVPHPAVHLASGSLVIRGARVYESPYAPVVEQADLLITDGRIVAVGPSLDAPTGARSVACDGCTVTAGFWNAHVHFTEPKWMGNPSTREGNSALADMLTSRGFTTVVDAGSAPWVTISMRRRIESGELAGPAIFTAAGALYPPQGVPFYLRESLPKWLLFLMAQPDNPSEAVDLVKANARRGADLLKLFTGSYVERGRVLPMPLPIAKAAVDTAHRLGQLVYSHASDLAGTRVALESGVDVLAHTPDTTDGIDDALLARLVTKQMAVIPTLKMFATTVTAKAEYVDPIHAVVRRFRALGGELLFGTDVGYMTDYATEDELTALADCGLSARDMLRALTTAPAARFGAGSERGTVEPGKVADLVLLDADPADDTSTMARPRATIRGGKVIFERDARQGL